MKTECEVTWLNENRKWTSVTKWEKAERKTVPTISTDGLKMKKSKQRSDYFPSQKLGRRGGGGGGQTPGIRAESGKKWGKEQTARKKSDTTKKEGKLAMKSGRLHAFSLSTSVFTEELHNPCPEVTDTDLQPQTPTCSHKHPLDLQPQKPTRPAATNTH